MTFQEAVDPFEDHIFTKMALFATLKETIPAEWTSFLIDFTTPLDSLMTSQNASFGQD